MSARNDKRMRKALRKLYQDHVLAQGQVQAKAWAATMNELPVHKRAAVAFRLMRGRLI